MKTKRLPKHAAFPNPTLAAIGWALKDLAAGKPTCLDRSVSFRT